MGGCGEVGHPGSSGELTSRNIRVLWGQRDGGFGPCKYLPSLCHPSCLAPEREASPRTKGSGGVAAPQHLGPGPFGQEVSASRRGHVGSRECWSRFQAPLTRTCSWALGGIAGDPVHRSGAAPAFCAGVPSEAAHLVPLFPLSFVFDCSMSLELSVQMRTDTEFHTTTQSNLCIVIHGCVSISRRVPVFRAPREGVCCWSALGSGILYPQLKHLRLSS